jgi:hypothetical protein
MVFFKLNVICFDSFEKEDHQNFEEQEAESFAVLSRVSSDTS